MNDTITNNQPSLIIQFFDVLWINMKGGRLGGISVNFDHLLIGMG